MEMRGELKEILMSVQTVFDKYASVYDSSRKKLIPCFDDFYQTAIETIPFPRSQHIKVLDLGAGTGMVAGLVAAHYPNAVIALVDIAEKILAEAREKLKCFPNDFSFKVANYADIASFDQYFDLIISALSIHHLTAVEKQFLFQASHTHLNPGGIFINADQVLGETETVEKIYHKRWVEQVTARGTTERELAAAFERMKEDKMSTLSAQLKWLKHAGFVDVNCWFKSYSFVVFSGAKETA